MEAFNKKINNSQEYNKNLYGGQATLQPIEQLTAVVYRGSEAQNEKLNDETETKLESEYKFSWQWKETEYGYECPACHCFFDYNSTYGIFDHNFAYASYCPNCGVKINNRENVQDGSMEVKKGRMKIAMISQPMRDKTKEEILAVRDEAKKKLTSMGYDMVNTYYYFDLPRSIKNEALYCLGQSLMDMACCDAVYFCRGWKDARGCRIEHEAAKAYGIECIYEGDEKQ